jgi:hypothetical protein
MLFRDDVWPVPNPSRPSYLAYAQHGIKTLLYEFRILTAIPCQRSGRLRLTFLLGYLTILA